MKNISWDSVSLEDLNAYFGPNSVVYFLLIILLAFPLIGFCLNGVLIYCMRQCGGHYPSTVLFLIQAFNLMSIVNCVTVFFLNGLQLLYQFITGPEKIASKWCTLLQVPLNLVGNVQIMLYVYMGLERWNATRNEANAAHETNTTVIVVKKRVAYLVIGGLAVIFTNYFLALSDEDSSRYFCGPVLVTMPPTFGYFAIAIQSVEVVTCIFYIFVWIINSRTLDDFSINTTRHSVIGRYNIKKTIESVKLVLPTLILHCVGVFMVMVVIQIILIHDMAYTASMDLVIGLMIPCFIAVHIIVHPMMLLFMSKHLRNKLSQLFPSIFCRLGSEKIVYDGNHGLQKMQVDSEVVEFRMKPDIQMEIMTKIWDHGRNKAKISLSRTRSEGLQTITSKL